MSSASDDRLISLSFFISLSQVYPRRGATSFSFASSAAKLQSERKQLESASSWIELNRRYTEMNKRIEAATRRAQLQTQAARAQSDLFNKGRSITASVITAEEDAAEAELSLIKLLSEQRKMEAQARLFVAVEGQ